MDIPNRIGRERRLTDKIAAVFDGMARSPGRIDWGASQSVLASAIESELEDTYSTMYLLLLDDSLPRTDAGQMSSRYARLVSGTVASGVMNNARSDIQGGAAPADVLNRSRAERIATTETTRAGTQASEVAVARNIAVGVIAATQIDEDDELIGEREPIEYDERWNAINDSRTCQICAALDGKLRPDWSQQYPQGPPAHPNCRCFIDYEER